MVRNTLLFVACVLVASCGHRTVELSTPPNVEASSDPTVVGRINEQVGWLTVTADRLYWTGRYAAYNPDVDGTGAALHSCNKTRCSETLVTYDASRLDTSAGYRVENGEVYWIQLKTKDGTSSYQLVTCPITGCDGPPRALYVHEIGEFRTVAFGPDAIYFSGLNDSRDVSRVPFSGAVEPQLLPQAGDSIQSLTVNGDYIYAITSRDYSQGGDVRLSRARTDGSTPFEAVAQNLKLLLVARDAYAALSPYVNLAFDDVDVYWTSNTLSGSIQRCPLAGCVNSPEVLTGPIRAPTALRLDGATAYFQYFDTTLGNALASCTLPHCEPAAPIAYGLDDGNVVAVDDEYVYTASGENAAAQDAAWDFPAAQIRRFPK